MRVVLSSRDVAVPSLVGRTVPEAGALSAQRGLMVRIEGRRHDPSVPAERVVAQEPPPGAALKAHRAVRVWVSLGPRRVRVPAVEGDSARSARIALEQSGVPVARVVEIEDAAPEGIVLVQRPPAGEADVVARARRCSSACGPSGASYVMPDLIGREAAAAVSRAAGGRPQGRRRALPQLPRRGARHRAAPDACRPATASSARTPLVLDVSREAS